MKITWFGHSCFRIDIGASSILIDPFLTGNATFEDAGIPLHKAVKGVTHVALTHGHEDHTGDTVRICKETDAQLLAVHELATYMAGRGVDKIDPGQYRRHALPWRLRPHLRSGLAFGLAHRGWAAGLSRRLLRAGDRDRAAARPSTIWAIPAIFSDMGLINEIYRPQIGFVPIGDRYTMGAKTAALACKRFFEFELIVPCHYGTFPVLDQTADKFIEEMHSDSVLVPEVGVAFEA